MKAQKTKFIWIATAIIGLLLVALALSLTLGAYRDHIFGYTDFGPASFNAAILFPEEVGDSEQILQNLNTQNFRPGMLWDADTEKNSAARIHFYVANGKTPDKAATVAMQYTIRVRTAQNLPLDYILSDGIDQYWSVPVENTGDQGYYEYYFVSASNQEQTFRLDAGTAENPLQSSPFTLFVQWPVENGSADVKFMKEVEIVEILVTVTSMNGAGESPDIQYPQDYASGIILLIPPEGELPEDADYTGSYSLQVDLRNFQVEETVGSYHFKVDNAMGLRVPDRDYTVYKLLLKIPERLELDFTLFHTDDQEKTNLLTEKPVEYRLYDEKKGTYWSVTVDANQAATVTLENGGQEKYDTLAALREKYPEPEYRLYALYDASADGRPLLQNFETVLGNKRPCHNFHSYTLQISVEGPEVLERLALKNRLELLVEAEFCNTV